MSDPESPARPAGRTVVRKKKPIRRWNEKRKQTFLAKLAETANVCSSAREVGLSKTAAYDLKKRDPAFAEAWRDALDVGFSELEMALLRQAMEGSKHEVRMERGEERELQYVKTTRSFTFVGPLRLLMAHREEVIAHRLARGDVQESDQENEARVRAHMDQVRERLIAQGLAPSVPVEEPGHEG